MSENDSLPMWLRAQIDRRDWNQADFARRLNLTPSVVSRWFTGARVPDPTYCDLIADALGVDVDVVLTLAGHRPPDVELDPDDPRVRLTGLVRRVDWTKEGRLSTIDAILRTWIEDDRRASGKAARSAEAGAGVP